MAENQKYEKFTDENIRQVQNSFYYQNNPQFDIKTPFPALVREIEPQGPNAYLEIHPPSTKAVFEPKFNLHFFKNDYNKENMVYISRNYWGGFWHREFNPILAHFLLGQDEFDKVIKKVEKIAGGFFWLKIFYIIFIIMFIISIILIIVGCTNNSDPAIMATEGLSAFEYLSELSNSLIAAGFILIIISLTLLFLTVICTLKKYEFGISRYFLKINQKKFLFRNIYWKVGAFCKFIQIQILPFTPQQFWLMQSQERMENEKKDKDKEKK